MTQHLGYAVPSPVIFKNLGDRFGSAVASFAEENANPVLRLKRPDRTRWATARSTTSVPCSQPPRPST
jgi:hypothetical protein